MTPQPLTAEERAVYDWQLDVPGFGVAGQERLKGASVLISRCGGLGGLVAYELAAAGVGRLVLAHGGNLRPDDLNRQLLMTWDHLGQPRMDSIVRRLRDLNPRLDLVAEPANIGPDNAARLVAAADVVVDCAPLFAERLLLNREAVRQGRPLVECAMYELQGQVTSIVPGRTPCLACLYPEPPPHWQRRFPVFGAVSGMIGCIGAMEAIKIIAGFGEPLYGRWLLCDLRDVSCRTLRIARRPGCPECGHLPDVPTKEAAQ